MELVYIILSFVFLHVCRASTEKRVHEVSHADTEITSHIVMIDLGKKWDDDVNDKYSDEYDKREYDFCSWVTTLFLTAIPFNTNTVPSLQTPKYESCRVENFNLVEKINGHHIVTVNFKMTFESRDYKTIASNVYETMNKMNKKPIVRIGDSILDEREFAIDLMTIVYNTHEVFSDGDIDNLPWTVMLFNYNRIVDSWCQKGEICRQHTRTITAFNRKMENVQRRRYVLKVIPANQIFEENKNSESFQSRGYLSAGHLSKSLFGRESSKKLEGFKRSNDMDEDELLKQLVALREKLNERE